MSKREQAFDELELLAIRKFIFRAAGFGPHDEIPDDYDLHDAVDDALDEMNKKDENRERIEQLEYTIDQLVTDLPTQTRSKREKLGAIVRRVAEDAPDGAIRSTINRDKAAGVADCTNRHALNLFDELGETFDWATYVPDKSPAILRIEFGEQGAAAFIDQIAAEFPEVEE